MRLRSLLVISVLSSLNLVSIAVPLKPQALPLKPTVRRRVAYSVVAVDGGSAATPPIAPVPDVLTLIRTSDSIETVTAAASSTPPSIETTVAINTVSELEPAKTVDITITQEVTKIPSPTTIPFYVVVNPAETPTSSSTVPLTRQNFTSVPSVKCMTSLPPPILSTSTWTSIPTISMSSASSNRVAEAAYRAEAKGPEATARYQSPSQLPAITSSSALPTASAKTYDDGMWHTSYPAWNATSSAPSSASATAVGTGRAQSLWKDG
ncbi:hypothetical protein IMSHALPRED_009826 [Imshaugia aleurites]|uniref:Uncharacterized protein n=1 Tax=Imshaugia aleurites TaxID=172621 RepID=A0A8H3G170_9LECA|nr:hypothetical protein IMSHALPRED_009826 [Imshaugia aleurites]